MNQLYRSLFLIASLFALSFSAKAQTESSVYFSMEKALQNPENVRTLDLSFQAISDLPDVFQEFPNLETLILRNNKIQSLPNSVYSLKKLNHLDLSGNISLDQKALFIGIDSLNTLEDLNLSHCNIRYLDYSVSGCLELKSLSLKGNYLFYLPYSLGMLENLETLDLESNFLTELPESFYRLDNLKSLNIGNNKMLKMDQVFGFIRTSQIENLQFQNQTIPSEIGAKFNRFNSLEFFNCTFTDVQVLEKLQSEKLVLNYCQGIDPSILFNSLAKDSLLFDFRLSDSSMKKVNLRAFAKLNIEYLKLELPNIVNWNNSSLGLNRMKKLSSLDLSNSNVQRFPANLNGCKNLKELNLNNCQIKEGGLKLNLSQLEKLDLRENGLSENEVEELARQNPNTFVSHDFMYKSVPAKVRPLPKMKQNIEWTSLNPTIPNRLNLKTGTEIIIPENAFVTKDGKVVKGEVDFSVEEFKNATDIFLSGLPMTYDSAGVSYTFASAGMMELRAYSKGEELDLAPDKQLEIKMTSEQEGNFNLYSLDDSTGAWTLEEASLANNISNRRPFLGERKTADFIQDSATWYSNLRENMVSERKEILKFKLKPHKKLNSFKINFLDYGRIKNKLSAQYFNETDFLKKYTFVYEGNNKKADYEKLESILKDMEVQFDLTKRKEKNRPTRAIKDTMRIINDMIISANEFSDNLRLTIFYGNEKLSFPVSIEIKSNKPESVQKEYSKFYTKYNRALNKRMKNWSNYYSIREADFKEKIDKTWAALVADGSVTEDGDIFIPGTTYYYGIGGLGIINCDRPLSIFPTNPMAWFSTKYSDKESKKRLNPKSIYVLDYSQNYALNYSKSKVKAYQKSHVVLVVLFKNGDYGIVYDFDQTRRDSERKKHLEFEIEVYDDSINFNQRLAPYVASLN